MAGSINDDEEEPKSRDVRPVPDPTVLTTKQLVREINSVREVIETRVNSVERALNREVAAVREIIGGMQRNLDMRPSAISEAFDRLKELHNERFHSIGKLIDVQFQDRDKRTEQQARDSKLAIDAALQAAKEAVTEQNKASALSIAKSEAATMKQIDQIGNLITASIESINSKLTAQGESLRSMIDDTKSRLTLLEGSGKGSKDLSSTLFTMAGVGIAVIAAIIAFMKLT